MRPKKPEYQKCGAFLDWLESIKIENERKKPYDENIAINEIN